jgi:phosphoenolpyruvate carboxylase
VRKIPATIASQHPDNALAPYWDKNGQPFISVYQEIDEAVLCFKELGVSEYMWDWEGKHADAAVIDRLFTDFYDYFAKHQLGRDKFLTFRIPNIWEEKGYNLLQAMTVVLSSEDFARDLEFHGRPLFEVILPMTERASQLMQMQKLFEKLARFKSKDFTPDRPANTDYLEIIPLVEGVDSQMAVDELLAEYVKLHQQHFGRRPEYIRSFLACSDSALSSGFLAGVLGNKLALAKLRDFGETSGIPVFPFMGAGSLPFRGGLAPDNLDRFLEEFPGVRTVTVQSAFRYDYPLAQVKTAIKRLEEELPKLSLNKMDSATQAGLQAIGIQASKLYKATLSGLAGDMQPVFKSVPKRRDRRQHIGLLAYSRSMGEQTLPRAITFTGAFYSVGVPPEFIGSGRALRQLKPAELALLKDHYPNLTNDFEAAGRYLNRDNLDMFAADSTAWQAVKEDVEAVEAVLGLQLGPKSAGHKAHAKLSSQLARIAGNTDGSDLIAQMGVLRKSLG